MNLRDFQNLTARVTLVAPQMPRLSGAIHPRQPAPPAINPDLALNAAD